MIFQFLLIVQLMVSFGFAGIKIDQQDRKHSQTLSILRKARSHAVSGWQVSSSNGSYEVSVY